MHAVETEIPKPTGDGSFEDMCARIYGVVFDDPTPTLNGRRGQAQAGIDVFVDAPEGRIGIQCKRYADGALKFKHVEQEVRRADQAETPIARLILATTAASDAKLIREVQDLSDRRIAAKRFPVKVEFWPELCRHIRASNTLQADYEPTAPGALLSRVDERHAEVSAMFLTIKASLDGQAGLPTGRADSLNRLLTSQLDAVNALLAKGRFQDAQLQVTQLSSDMSVFDAHQHARLLVQRGICAWHLSSTADAAPHFLRAAALYSDDEKIVASQVRGHLFLGQVDNALAIAALGVERFPNSIHVWLADANARMISGQVVGLTDAPEHMRENADVLQLCAWSQRNSGNLAEAVALSAKASGAAEAGFFVRNTALSFALETAAGDAVRVGYGLVDTPALDDLRRAVLALIPRNEKVWTIQSEALLEEVSHNLGYAHLVLGEFDEVVALINEARVHGVDTPSTKRIVLEAYRRLDQQEKVVDFGSRWLPELEEEAMLLVAEVASSLEDVKTVEAVRQAFDAKGLEAPESRNLLQALRWVAMWASGDKVHALKEVQGADLESSDSLALICGGARVLNAANEENATDVVLARAVEILGEDAPSPKRLLLADLLFSTSRYELAAVQYKALAPAGLHSELHNRLLRCYVKTGALRKAKDLVSSFPDGWTSNENALGIAIELGQKAADWEFLVPLADAQCTRHPDDVGGWLIRLAVDLKMRKMAEFHQRLAQVPLQLQGATRLIAQLAGVELRFGRAEQGLRRLYSLFRRNMDDAGAASAYFISLLGGPPELPLMDDPHSVAPGSTVVLKDVRGASVTASIDPTEIADLPRRDGFYAPGDQTALAFIGAVKGQEVDLLGPMGSRLVYTVESISSVYRHLIALAQQRLHSPDASAFSVIELSVKTTQGQADFSEMHALLKRDSEHGRRALDAYGTTPITLGGLGRLLGRGPVAIVLGWQEDGPPLYTCSGEPAQRNLARELLQRRGAAYVIDAATVVEMASLDCLDALAVLPNLFATTKSVEILEAHLEDISRDRDSGTVFDDNGKMRFVEHTAEVSRRHAEHFRHIIQTVRDVAQVVPAYGPDPMPDELAKAESVLSEEEFSVLLLTAEKGATLFSVDGRLGVIGRAFGQLESVWPQEVLAQAVQQGVISRARYSYALICMLLRNRTFVSLDSFDLGYICFQGRFVLQNGIQKFKEFLASATCDFTTGFDVSMGFLSLQASRSTQIKAFFELIEHIVEALLRHPQGLREQESVLARVEAVARRIGKMCAQGTDGFAGLEEGQKQARIQTFEQHFAKTVHGAKKFSEGTARIRLVRLKAVKGPAVPFLAFDGEVDTAEEVSGTPRQLGVRTRPSA